MGILMAGLSPHPPLIIPEIGGDRRSGVKETINGLEELAQEVKESDPDLLITISPHGPVFKDAISTIEKPELAGDFSEFGHPEIELRVESNMEYIEKLRENTRNNNIELIDVYKGDFNHYNISSRLDHGVLVPLYYLKKSGVDVPLVALTMGLLNYKSLYKFGYQIYKTINDLSIKAVIIASGDLSHRLKPGAPAGYNPRGEEFDKKLVDLLKKEEFLEVLDLDQVLIEKAGECGLRPLIILLGALQKLDVKTDVKSYEGPFGVGYSVTGFYPVKE